MPSKATSVRFAGRINLKDSATAAQELVVARTRFIPGTGGRADFIATQGDVPAGKAFFGSACWDAQEKEGFAILRLCEKASAGQGPSCQVIATRGQLSNCRLLESLPPEDPSAAGAEPEAPATDVGEPTVMPSGAGE